MRVLKLIMPQGYLLAAIYSLVLFVHPTLASALDMPATGVWNGFLGQLNVVECTSLSSTTDSFRLSVRGNSGNALGEFNFALKPNETRHLILNELAIADNFGTYLLEQTVGSNGQLRCHSAFYRSARSDARKSLDYAFSIPVSNPSLGTTSGIYNSFNPQNNVPVFNWLSIYNPGSSSFSAQVNVYAQDGSLDADRSFALFALAPGQRRDFPLGHDRGHLVGLYEIVPQESTSPYGAFATRYSRLDDGSFNFAFALPSSSGSCDSVTVPVSTMDPARNWAELANLGSASVQAQFEVRSPLGAILHQETRLIAPRSQSHLFLNSIIGERALGILQVSCADSDRTNKNLISQSVYYGQRDSGSSLVEWAYATQATRTSAQQGERVVNFVNTFFDAANWSKVFDLNLVSAAVSTTQYNADGVPRSSTDRSLATGGSLDIGLHQGLNSAFVGLAVNRTGTATAGFSSELLRVYPHADGGIGNIMNVRSAIAPAAELPAMALSEIASGLSKPVYLTHAGDNSGRLFVVEQTGLIRIIEGNALLPTPFLDVSDRISTGGERGLLSVAFHPNYSTNGRLFVYYINTSRNTVVAEYRVNASNPNLADVASQSIIFTQDQPFGNHNGGLLKFGPDGFLYIGLGDGGSGGDPFGHGQNLNTVLGALLRIDINNGAPYTVPTDNPFVGVNGARPEIWAYGLRNPWRYSFDRQTGRLFLGDVGQSTVEEIDIIVKGGNYGWNTMEGTRCFNPTTNCDTTGLILPITEYPRTEGISVTGGYVYRGTSIVNLAGTYLFADFGSSRIWALTEQGGGWQREEILRPGFLISSFGEDQSGELYVLDFNGSVYKIRQADS